MNTTYTQSEPVERPEAAERRPAVGTSDLIRAAGLSKSYRDGDVRALIDVDFSVPSQQFVAIMGPSGSGKSTLLNLLGALDVPNSGELYFEGRPYQSWRSLDYLRAEQIGFVFQSFHLLPTLTALENVQIPMFGGARSAGTRRKVAAELLDSVGMSHRLKHLPNRLSVGERQRVSIARALANNPTLLLADEPTGNLDSKTGRDILELFERLRAERKMTLIVVTHTNEVSERAERTVRLLDGRIVSDERRT